MESVQDHEYINIEVDPLATILCHSNKEFEFQSFAGSSETNRAAICSADQLFYMGKLLPLHLPPRLQMLDKILQTSSKPSYEFDNESFSTPLFSASNTSTANTPFESCNVSPVESRQVSGELNPNHEYFVEYTTSFKEKKYSWAKRLKLIKQSSSIGSKLKRAFLKSLFTKSGCSYESSAAADAKKSLPKTRHSEKGAAKNVPPPFGQIQAVKCCSNKKMILSLRNKENNLTEDCQASHRRSFSGPFKRLSKSSSSMSDYSRSAGVQNSCGTNLELENSIQAAIAHCKRSQNQPSSKNVAGEQILCPMPASSQVVLDDQERTGRCRG